MEEVSSSPLVLINIKKIENADKYDEPLFAASAASIKKSKNKVQSSKANIVQLR